MAMCCPVVPGKSEAKYENGLLRIMVPFKDAMDGAREVKVA
jgi:HSP20 family molecular chaperone IbpA